MSENVAIKLLARLGILARYEKTALMPSHTKKGPGRRHLQGKPKKDHEVPA